MSTSAPKFYDVRLSGGPITLCNACLAVLVQEGTLAGDPREESIPASDVLRITLAPTPTAGCDLLCDTCESLRRYELHRPVLQAPPARLGCDCRHTKTDASGAVWHKETCPETLALEAALAHLTLEEHEGNVL